MKNNTQGSMIIWSTHFFRLLWELMSLCSCLNYRTSHLLLCITILILDTFLKKKNHQCYWVNRGVLLAQTTAPTELRGTTTEINTTYSCTVTVTIWLILSHLNRFMPKQSFLLVFQYKNSRLIWNVAIQTNLRCSCVHNFSTYGNASRYYVRNMIVFFSFVSCFEIWQGTFRFECSLKSFFLISPFSEPYS